MYFWSLQRLSCAAVGVIAAAFILSSTASPAFSGQQSDGRDGKQSDGRDGKQSDGRDGKQSDGRDGKQSGDDDRWKLTENRRDNHSWKSISPCD
jgi:hypothetical protein